MEPVLYTMYKKEVIPALKEAFGYDNIHEIPKIEKVVLNVGYGRHAKDKAYIENVEETLRLITGQQPVHNEAKKSISNFKIREGMRVGASTTLRGAQMYEFLYRLIHVTFPRIRDFRGISPKGFDAHGNYCVGMKENTAFPEVTVDSSDKIHGIEIVIHTTADTAKEGRALLTHIGFPFQDK